MDPDAATILEAVVGWAGEPGRLFNAWVRAGLVEKLEIGARVKGLDRYVEAWETARRGRERARAWRDAQRGGTKPGANADRTRTNGVRTPGDGDGDGEEAVTAAAPPPISRPKPKPPAVALPPEAEAWLVWQSGEWERRFASLTSPPPAAEFLVWWEAAMADLHRLGQGEPELRTAYRAFLADDYWATKSRRRCPWSGWAKQWRDFLPAKGAGPPTRGKRLEVIPYPDAEVPDAAAV
jgi:hypothetical protein